jgi:hypothetical protein
MDPRERRFGPRDRRVDWEPVSSLRGADPEIPVVHLRDQRPQDRDSLALIGDQDRWLMAEILDRAQEYFAGEARVARRAPLIESWWVRGGIVVGAVEVVIQVLQGTGVLGR